MVRDPKKTERVHLAPADWGGLCSLCLTVIVLAGATLYEVHNLDAEERVRQARKEAELAYMKTQVKQLQTDVRELVRSRRRDPRE